MRREDASVFVGEGAVEIPTLARSFLFVKIELEGTMSWTPTDPVDHYVKVLSVMNCKPMKPREIKNAISVASPNKVFKVSTCLHHLRNLGLVDRRGKGFVLTEKSTQALQAPVPHDALTQIHQEARSHMVCNVADCGATEDLEWFQVKWWCPEHLRGEDRVEYSHQNMCMLALAPGMASGWTKEYLR